MKNITFIPSWQSESIEQYNVRMARQTPSGTGRWKNVQIVYPPTSSTYAICQDGIQSILTASALGFTRDYTVYIKRESDLALAPFENIEKYCIASYQGSGKFCPSVWWLGLTWDELIALEPPPKLKKLSTIVSSLENMPLHKKRLDFIRGLSERTNIDVYGKGHRLDAFSGKYKGEVHGAKFSRCKAEALSAYKYSIAIENNTDLGYFTEKLCDCLLMFCIPLYYGAPDINMYFPADSIISLKSLEGLHLEKLCEELDCDSLHRRVNLSSLKYARELILFKYNMINVVARLVEAL